MTVTASAPAVFDLWLRAYRTRAVQAFRGTRRRSERLSDWRAMRRPSPPSPSDIVFDMGLLGLAVVNGAPTARRSRLGSARRCARAFRDRRSLPARRQHGLSD